MKLAELMDKNPRSIFANEIIFKGDMVALDGKNGKKLFDTRVNKREYVNKFMNAEVISLWADVRLIKGIGFGDYFRPVMKCYLSHDSWKESDGE